MKITYTRKEVESIIKEYACAMTGLTFDKVDLEYGHFSNMTVCELEVPEATGNPVDAFLAQNPTVEA
jgi:hypothetical protein